MFTLVVLIVTIVVCLSHVCFGHFKYLSAHNYKVRLGSQFGGMAPSGSLYAPPQIDTKENDLEAVENGRPARPSSSSVSKSQVSPFGR